MAAPNYADGYERTLTIILSIVQDLTHEHHSAHTPLSAFDADDYARIEAVTQLERRFHINFDQDVIDHFLPEDWGQTALTGYTLGDIARVVTVLQNDPFATLQQMINAVKAGAGGQSAVSADDAVEVYPERRALRVVGGRAGPRV